MAELQPGTEHAWLERLPLPAVISRDQRIFYANEAFLTLLGRPREQVIGLRFDEPVAPEDVARIRERHARRLRGERVPDVYELAVVRGDGARRTVEIHVVTLGADTLFQMYDVTGRVERGRNLDALARLGAAVLREPSVSAIFARVGAGLAELGATVLRLSFDGGLVRVIGGSGVGPDPGTAESPQWPCLTEVERAWRDGYALIDDLPVAAARLLPAPLGTTADSARRDGRMLSAALSRIDVGGVPTEVLCLAAPWLRPADEPTVRLFASQLGAALDTRTMVSRLEVRNEALTALDRVAAAAGTARDVTELFQQAAPLMCAVAECAAIAVFLVDETAGLATLAHAYGGSEEASRLFARVPLEGTRLGDAVRARKTIVWRRTDYDELRQAVMKRMGQEVVASVPMIVQSRVVGVINAARATAVEFGADHLDLLNAIAAHLAAAVESNRLMGDLRNSLFELSRTQAQLVQRERLAALGEMSAAVAHEVRNPLAVIFNGLAALKKEKALGDNAEEILLMVQEEASRIDHLVNDLLDLARPAALKLSETPLASLVQEAVGAVLKRHAAPITFAFSSDPDLGAVALDPRQMRQVFENLATNAALAMPDGGRLEVSLTRNGDAAGPVRISFQDTGHGIPLDALQRVFEPFFTTRAKGTGLGLTVVRRIVEAHRGNVRIASEPGRRTEVVVTLPPGAPPGR